MTDDSARRDAARAALEIEDGPWELDFESDEGDEFPDAHLVGKCGCLADIHLLNGDANARHIALNDPAAVLVGIEERERKDAEIERLTRAIDYLSKRFWSLEGYKEYDCWEHTKEAALEEATG